MSLLYKIFDNLPLKFFIEEERTLKILLDAAYRILKLDNPDWEIYDEYTLRINRDLQAYDGRFKNYLKSYYNKIREKESFKR